MDQWVMVIRWLISFDIFNCQSGHFGVAELKKNTLIVQCIDYWSKVINTKKGSELRVRVCHKRDVVIYFLINTYTHIPRVNHLYLNNYLPRRGWDNREQAAQWLRVQAQIKDKTHSTQHIYIYTNSSRQKTYRSGMIYRKMLLIIYVFRDTYARLCFVFIQHRYGASEFACAGPDLHIFPPCRHYHFSLTKNGVFFLKFSEIFFCI